METELMITLPNGTLVSLEQHEALLCTYTAIQMIEPAHQWSDAQRLHILLLTYEGLEWYASQLGMSLDPASTEDAILQATERFKTSLDQRYPGWQFLQERQVKTGQQEPITDASSVSKNIQSEEETEILCSEPLPEEPITGEDCRCTNHTGLHWLYHDYWWYERNLAHLERCLRHVQRFYELYLTRDHDPTAARLAREQRMWAELAFQAFSTEEIPRLQEKIYEMEARKLTRIPYEVLGPGFENLSERERSLLRTIRETSEQVPPSDKGHHAS